MGVYCINRSVIASLPRGGKYGFDNLMVDRLAKNQEINIVPFSGYWLDIGRPDDYQYADDNFSDLSVKLGIPL
jgi:NDP-sugar pyrophosphorylase family protein